ncbi:MAG TPA: hypothetical protein VH249_16765 [Xanthobacteraceae bacterium]|nr:hypothetical protein [Xanthobacteraceae bacterium]
MARIRCKRPLTIAAAMLGVGLATWGAQAVRSQAETAGYGEPPQQGDVRLAAGTREDGQARRQPTPRSELGVEVAARKGGTGTKKGTGVGQPKTGAGSGFDKGSQGAQGTGFDNPKGGAGSGGGTKTFVIDHPEDPRRYLVHATLEGPEGAVFYRGSARLDHGRAEVALPSYFESLTLTSDRTVILTNIDGFDRLAVETQRDGKVANGRFVVVSDNPDSAQAFDWEVKAVRKDVPRLVEAPLKTEISVAGFGPYTFIDRP